MTRQEFNTILEIVNRNVEDLTKILEEAQGEATEKEIANLEGQLSNAENFAFYLNYLVTRKIITLREEEK